MRAAATLAILRKEIKDTLRDRRTLFVMLVLPIFLYPVMIVGFIRVNLSLQKSLREEVFTIWIEGRERLPTKAIDFLQQAADKLELVDRSATDDDATLLALKLGEVDALVQVPAGFQERLRSGGQGAITIAYFEGVDKSALAFEKLSESLEAYGLDVRGARMEARGIAPEFLEPVAVREKNLGGQAIKLARALALMLTIMSLTGAFYPALDLGAGEKERGTLETLLLTPATRGELAAGKYLAVTAIALVSGLLNVAALGATFLNLGALVDAGDTSIPIQMDLGVLLAMLCALVPLVSLFSALTLAVSTYAASYKEGSNYLSPLMILVMLPAMVATLPGVRLGVGTSLVPILGPTLLFRDLLSGTAWTYQVALVTLSSLVYAGLAIRWVAGLYQREDVLMRPAASSGSASPLGFFKRLRGDPAADSGLPAHLLPRLGGPSTVLSLSAIGVAFLVVWFIGLRLQKTSILTGSAGQALGLLVFAGVGVALLGRCKLGEALLGARLGRRQLLGVLGGLLIGGALFVWSLDLAAWQRGWSGARAIEPSTIGAALAQLQAMQASSWLWLVLALAVLPALGEELVFRGLVLRGLRRDFGPLWATVGAALGGAAIHLSPEQSLASFLSGLAAGLVALRLGSVWPAVALQLGLKLPMAALTRSPTLLMEYSLMRPADPSSLSAGLRPALGLEIAAAAAALLGLALVLRFAGRRPAIASDQKV